jgi:hypothetical protein
MVPDALLGIIGDGNTYTCVGVFHEEPITEVV